MGSAPGNDQEWERKKGKGKRKEIRKLIEKSSFLVYNKLNIICLIIAIRNTASVLRYNNGIVIWN